MMIECFKEHYVIASNVYASYRKQYWPGKVQTMLILVALIKINNYFYNNIDIVQ